MTFPIGGRGHPSKTFYRPGEAPAAESLGHVVGDGYVVALYRPDLPQQSRQALRRWVESSSKPIVIAAPHPAQREAIHVVTAQRDLRCSEVDLDRITTFRDRWLRELYGEDAGVTRSP